MKRLLLIFLSLFFIHCHNNPDVDVSQVTGRWLLVASLKDPGDGSGRFVAPKEEYTIGFGTDGNFKDNNNLFCQGDNLEYLIDESLAQITINGCAVDPEIFDYELTQGILILYNHRCIEQCALKFRKYKD